MKEKFELFLDKSQLPEDVESLQDMIVMMSKMYLETLDDFSKQMQINSENIEYLNAELAVLRRFQYGQRSERLKKKQLRLLTKTA